MVGVRLVGLAKRFGEVEAVRPLDLEVARGELLVLLGPSGCGKSTVLRMIAGVEEPTGGEVWIEGDRVDHLDPAQRDIAMVFQSYALYPHMSVRDNLSFGLRMRRTPRSEIDRRVTWAASLLDLGGLLDRRPGQLSGGQRQRVALGRAMVREPSVFLFDEPLSNLDARLRAEMRDEVAALHRRLGTTMIFVTHDQVEAMSLGQRIAVLREGALQQCDAPMDLYHRPANLFVARFVGSPVMNTTHGRLVPDGNGCRFEADGLALRGTLSAPEGGAQGLPVVLGVRTEDLTLAEPGPDAAHYVTEARRVEALGRELRVHVAGPGGTAWIAQAPPDHPVAAGDRVGLRIRGSATHVFDERSEARLGALGEAGA